jgi:hypothetical protein
MLKFGGIFGGGEKSNELTSLKLETPIQTNPTPTVPAKTVQELMQQRRQQQAKFDQTPLAAAIQRRTKGLLDSGQHPTKMYYGRHASGLVPMGFVSQDKTKGILLVFSSPMLAHQLYRSKQFNPNDAPFEVIEFQLNEMEDTARFWKSHGFSAVIFNWTLKKKAPAPLDAGNGTITSAMLLQAWAANRVACEVAASAWRTEYLNGKEKGGSDQERWKRQRLALENLRDMGASDVPFVHWLIALLSGMLDDEETRLAATAVLEQFGPDFVGKTSRSDEARDWGRSMAIATTGLMAEFGMLTGPDGAPVPSMLKIHSETVEQTD